MGKMRKEKIKKILNYLLVGTMGVFLAFGVFHERITKVCFAIGLGLYLILRILEYGKDFYKNLIVKTPLNKAIYIFLGVCLISVIFSTHIDHSQQVFFQRYIPYFALFFIGAYLAKDRRNFKILIFSLMFGAFVVSVGGVVDLIQADKFKRLFTSYGIGCLYGAYFLYTLPFFISFTVYHFSKKIKFLSFLTGVPLVVCFLFNYYRGVWISLIAGLLTSCLTFKKTRKIGIILIILILGIIFIFPVFRNRLFKEETLEPTTWADRVPMWETAWYAFKDKPIVGMGLGTYEFLIGNYDTEQEFKKAHHVSAHNTYLGLLSQTGLLGLLSFLWLLFLLLKVNYKKLKNNFGLYKFSFILITVSVLIHELVSSTILIGVSDASVFWFLMGIGITRINFYNYISIKKVKSNNLS